MKAIITNVQQFENLTNCSRTTSKNIIDKCIEYYNITCDDLIADIYASCGIDSEESFSEPETKDELTQIEILGIESFFNKFYQNHLELKEATEIEFFYAGGLLNSVDMANGIPMYLEGFPISHLTMNDAGCVFVVCEVNETNFVYYNITTNGGLYLMK
jgi:hypothetical protein